MACMVWPLGHAGLCLCSGLSGLGQPAFRLKAGPVAGLTGQPDSPCKGSHPEQHASGCSERCQANSLVKSLVSLTGWQVAGLILLRI